MRHRLAVASSAAFALALVVPALAASNAPQSTGTLACGDGTITWTPTSLWAPNHKLQTITVSYQAPADTAGDTSTVTIGAISDNQAAADGSDETLGSGQPTDQQGLDWAGTGNTATAPEGSAATTTAQVRAERSGTDQAGRTYSIQVMCTEANNGVPQPQDSGTVTITVTVPHDQRR